jgi:hypothetical protein
MLNDEARCEGHTRVNGQLLGLCVACERLHQGGHAVWIAPEAKRLSGGEWFCPNRRSSGTPGLGANVVSRTDGGDK